MMNQAFLALLAAATALCVQPRNPRNAENVVNIYNWADYIGKDTLAQFERRTGIKVVYDTYDSDETLEARMMAGDSGNDVVEYSPTTSAPDQGGHLPAIGSQQAARLEKPRSGRAGRGRLSRSGQPVCDALSSPVNGFAYHVDLVRRARMSAAPVTASTCCQTGHHCPFSDCGVTFLDSAEDVLQLALTICTSTRTPLGRGLQSVPNS